MKFLLFDFKNCPPTLLNSLLTTTSTSQLLAVAQDAIDIDDSAAVDAADPDKRLPRKFSSSANFPNLAHFSCDLR